VLTDALSRVRAELDELNVFPVPDGDTGTNLYMTVVSAAQAVDQLPVDTEPAVAWLALADGALAGARGSSGMILSQILRGMADVLGRGGGIGDAMRQASLLAYQAVSRPVEGTMLTVLRVAASASAGTGESATVARTIAQLAHVALGETTAQLDVLANSGVVDAGAAGLCVVLDTLADVICDESVHAYDMQRIAGRAPENAAPRESPVGDYSGGRYEVMYLLEADESGVSQLRTELDQIGDSLIVVVEDGIVSIHLHTDNVAAVLAAANRVGRPHKVRITNLGPPGVRGSVGT
jgi:uncharacterized protein